MLGGVLPTVNGSAIAAGDQFFVVNASGNTYKLSLTSGGAAVTLGGSPSGVVALKVPQSSVVSMPAGVNSSGSVNGSSNISNSGSTTGPIVLDAYDLAELYCYVTHSNTVSFNNCYLSTKTVNAPAIQCDPPSTAINVRYCEFNGGGFENKGSGANGGLNYVMYTMKSGTFEYNYIHNVSVEVIAPDSNSTFQFNLIFDCGYGPDVNHLEMFSGQPGVSNYNMRFNTWYQPVAVGGYPMELDTSVIFFQTPGNTSTGLIVDSNTIVGKGSTHRSTDGLSTHPAYNEGIYINAGGGGGSTISPRVTNNYFDTSSMEASGFCILTDVSVSGLVATGNVSMTTGAAIVANVTGLNG